MKVRSNFVTNSSSVSYILTMNEETFDIMVRMGGNKGFGDFLNFVKNKIKNEGNKINLDGEELYSLKLEFNTDDALPFDNEEIYEYPFEKMLEVIDNLDVKTLDNEELNSLLYWAILRPRYLPYVGATRVKTY